MRNIILGLLSSFTFSVVVNAGVWSGGGGAGVHCPQKQNVVLLDKHEMKKRGFILDLPGASELQKIGSVFERLQAINPGREKKYRNWYKNFYQETRFFSSGHLGNISDTGPVIIPEGCELVQVAAQNQELLPGDKRYIIDKSYWDQMSLNDRVALILHELVLREFLHDYIPLDTTKGVRYFTGVLISNLLNTDMSYESYFNITSVVRFLDIETRGGIPIKTSEWMGDSYPPEFWENGELKIAKSHFYNGSGAAAIDVHLAPGQIIKAREIRGVPQDEIIDKRELENGWVTFNQDGTPRNLIVSQITSKEKKLFFYGYEINLDKGSSYGYEFRQMTDIETTPAPATYLRLKKIASDSGQGKIQIYKNGQKLCTSSLGIKISEKNHKCL